ncbi:hypothetical protein FOZ63_017399, partial [Perkinsus olseni]
MRLSPPLTAAVAALALGLSGCSSSKSATTTPVPSHSGTTSPASAAPSTSPTPLVASVDAPMGPMAGVIVHANDSFQQPIIQDVEAFYGIPFAEPPLGDLRFRAPQALND